MPLCPHHANRHAVDMTQLCSLQCVIKHKSFWAVWRSIVFIWLDVGEQTYSLHSLEMLNFTFAHFESFAPLTLQTRFSFFSSQIPFCLRWWGVIVSFPSEMKVHVWLDEASP